MGVTILYGTAGSGKSTRLFQDIKEKRKTGKPSYLITPEQFSFTAEKKLLEELGEEAVIDSEVLTFQRMAYRFLKESKEQEKKHLTPSGKAMIIASILLAEKKNLKFLGKSNENIELVQKQIKEFKKHGVTVADLEQVWETEENPYFKAKIQDMLVVYRAYEKRIEGDYLDEDDLLSFLLEKLEDSKEFEGAYIYIDEFVGFTKQEYLVIGKLMEQAEEVTIAVCTDTPEDKIGEETDLFYENKKTVARILQLAEERNCTPVQYFETTHNRFQNEELAHLSRNIYAVPYHRYQKPVTHLSVFLASNAYTEVEQVAKEIRKLVKEENYRYQDIAIISKDLENYGDLCRVLLKKQGIPFFIDEKRDLSQNILIKYILSILDVFSKNWSFEAVFSYIKMGFLPLEDDEVYRLEEYASKWSIRGSKWYRGEWKMLKDQKEPDKILHARKVAIEPLAELKEKMIRKTAREISEELYQFLMQQKVDQKMEQKRKEFAERGMLETAGEYQNSWKIVMELLDELVTLFGDEKMGLDKYMQLLRVGLVNRSFGKIPPAQDQVTIGDVDRSKAHKVKAIFIIGVNDGVFPATYQSEGFFDDKDREAFQKHQIELAKGTKDRLLEDRFNLYKAFSIAEEKLFVSYVSSDLEGSTLRPSVLIGKLKRIFPELSEKSDVIEKEYNITNEVVTFEELLSKLRKAIEGEPLEEEWLTVWGYYQENPKWKEKLAHAISGILDSALPEEILPENVDKLYGETIQTSVSKLEQYASCAFSYYLKYALRLKEQERAQIKAMDTGSFLHDLIDSFLEYVKEQNISLKEMEETEVDKIVKQLVTEKLQLEKNYIFTINQKYQFLVVRLTKLLKTALLHILASLRESNFEVLGNEIEFKKRKRLSTNRDYFRKWKKT